MTRLSEIQVRDPFVLREQDTYYLFGSTDKDIWSAPGVGFDAYRGVGPGFTAELEGPFPAFRPPAGFWSRRNFWAPEVHRYRGGHYMLATFLPTSGRRGTAVLRSTDGPLGPYEQWSTGPVTPAEWECLDGTLFVDDEGAPWLVFCHEWVQVGDGEVCALRLTPDLTAADGDPVLLFTGSQAAWAAAQQGRPPHAQAYVTDGPFLYRYTDGRLSMLWSSYGAHGGYLIGEAFSPTGRITGPWQQSEQPLYDADAGHGMLFRSASDELYLAVHTPNDSPRERAIFVQVAETADGLVTTGTVMT